MEKMLESLPFECEINNRFHNLWLWVHLSPSEEKIILIDLNVRDREGAHAAAHYLKLLPEGTKNVVFFGKDRRILPIPSGDIERMSLTVGDTGGMCCVSISIFYHDESEHTVQWVP